MQVTRLRLSQFGEDAGPTAHPIRPDEVGKMDNFYSEYLRDRYLMCWCCVTYE